MPDQRIYWVDAPMRGRLAVVSRPRKALHVSALKAAGVDTLVSLLAPDEAIDVGLGQEADWCAETGVSFLNIPIIDHGVPSSFQVIEDAMDELANELKAGRGVAAHCFAGLGRSPLLVASVLVHLGWSDLDAVAAVSQARGYDVPEMHAQHLWLAEFAERRQERFPGR